MGFGFRIERVLVTVRVMLSTERVRVRVVVRIGNLVRDETFAAYTIVLFRQFFVGHSSLYVYMTSE